MKQKIVVKVEMHCGKCRSKAMKIAAVTEGVISVAIGGEEKDRVEVIGEGVDSAALTKCLRKKVGYATLLSVEEIKPKVDKKIDEETPTPRTCCCQNPALYIATMDYPDQRNCPIM